MKLLYKAIWISLAVLTFTSCDEVEWQDSDTALTPIYLLTDLNDDISLHAVEVYKEKALLIEFEKASTLKSFAMVDFKDKTSSEGYLVNYTLEREALTEDDNDTTLIRFYHISGTAIDSVGVYEEYEITAANDTVLSATSACTIYTDERLF
ncbi:hypothetical protein [Saccharicrinis aurantiacus]|uniref:hypothetical protein n=1 Tax=Saccharicrinis aurantiacus TaxID=1849719 RepID=UPI00249394E9|nr:hypothetical protein [Saccharicrinis aurantiacus]